MNKERINEILSYYPTLNKKQRENLLKVLNYGRIGGSGKLVILPVDQGFEHGPGRSFEPNPAAYNPTYHAELAIQSGCNAYAAPLGFLEAADEIIKKNNLPTILKINSHDSMMADGADPLPAVTSWVDDAIRLGCVAVGFTIYPGSTHAQQMYEQVKQLRRDAERAGLILVIWTYPRGSGLPSKEAETAVDVISYGVQIAAQLGAHIIKCKPPKNLIGLPEHIKKKIYETLPIETLSDRMKIVMKSAFDGRRIVINSGGDSKDSKDLLEEIDQLNRGGSYGSIVGRNAFQRPLDEAIKLLNDIQDTYTS